MKHRLAILATTFGGSLMGVALFYFILTSGVTGSKINAYVVLSGSMEPALPTGSVVITKSAASYEPNDVITFAPNGNRERLVTHRIVSASEGGFVTQGDANEEADTWKVQLEQISGKAVTFIPFVGYAVDFAKTPKGFVALVIIPASIIIYEELKSIFFETKRHLKKVKLPTTPSFSFHKAFVVLPIIGALFLVVAATGSYFLDKENSGGNTLGVAESFGGTPTPTSTPTADNLVINEYMPQPITGEFDWVEIYNPTSQAVSLVGWAVDEGDQNPKPLDTFVSIPAGGYVVYEHTNNAWLDNSGETIDLIDPNNQIIDTDTYGGSTSGVSIGRVIDGTGAFQNCTTTTKGSTNNGSC